MNWGVFDYVVAAGLIACLIAAYRIFSRKTSSKRNRFIIGGLLVSIFLVIWAELAVGLFD